MNTTANYQLSQWEGADRILMENFNRDNQKVDAALAAHDTALAAKAAASALPQFVTGSYVGTGQSGQIHYTVGARPKFLLLAAMATRNGAHYCGLLATETFHLPFYSSTGMTGATGLVTFTDDGFTINHVASQSDYAFNRSGVSYRYLAICG